jgi:ribonucleoside-triphosphate reductase (thioredoxin)
MCNDGHPSRARPPPERSRQSAADDLARYVFAARYAQPVGVGGRLETFEEAVARVRGMHRRFFHARIGRAFPARLPRPVAALAGADAALLAGLVARRTLGDVIDIAFAAAAERRVLPSLRSLQCAGERVLRNHARLFNCAFSNVDRLEFFGGYLFLLLCGCGVGFSVQRHHVARLPALPDRTRGRAIPHRIADTPEGWGDALDALLSAAFAGRRIVFAGGAGQPALRSALPRVARVLRGAAGRQLRPVEVYDIAMLVAAAARAPGGRRAATICLFSPDDAEMLKAKSGRWLLAHPERAASNNSAVIPRRRKGAALLEKVLATCRILGEPGIFFCDHPDAGCNPCGEISLLPIINWRPSASERVILSKDGVGGGRRSGFQLCNLTTINGAAARTAEDFLRACVAATVIGTLQAAFTRIPYLGPVTRVLNERDALLGVSICGFMDNPALLLTSRLLRRGARLCRATNFLVSALIGIRPAARITTCKPEGTASLLLGTAPGIHPYHGHRFLRRLVVDRRERAYACFRASNPHLTAPSAYHPETDDVITFPGEAPPGAVVRSDLSALDFLRAVLLVRRHWVVPGADPAARCPGLHHNVSHTCTVRPGEWEAVRAFLWRHRRSFSGVALLPEAGDRAYPQAPFEAVLSRSELARWRRLFPRPVDYSPARAGKPLTPWIAVCGPWDCAAI